MAVLALGVASLIIWTLFFVVWVKYVMLVMKADYHGEGGIFALMAWIFGNRVTQWAWMQCCPIGVNRCWRFCKHTKH